MTDRPRPSGPHRTAPLDPGTLDPERRALHDAIAGGPRAEQSRIPLVDDHGRLLGPFGAMLFSPGIGGAVQQVGAALRTDPDLPPRLRELAVLTVAAHTRSAFEWSSHEASALDTGLTRGQLQALLDGAEPAGLDDAELITVRVVRDLLTRHDVDDGRYAEALSALGRDTLAAVVWLAGYYAMLAGALAVFRPAGADPAV
ncbi:carboxymuconolactone decarboxylase family protein [Pseudonocardia nantongensis]|uniref:carboxymuconolactone decarboxylase family protein n=1 Tax=Pseudonocardia nantongensis TaxID=1181885 RepID=UPI00397CA9B3